MKNLGIYAIILGAVLLILCMFVPPMQDLADNNFYTIGSFALIFAGLILHIILNKKFM